MRTGSLGHVLGCVMFALLSAVVGRVERLAAQDVFTGTGLTWDYHLPDGDTFQPLSFRLVVDGKPDVALLKVNCVGRVVNGVVTKDADGLLIYDCEGAFPTLTNTVHTLQMFARLTLPSGAVVDSAFATTPEGSTSLTGRTVFVWVPTNFRPKKS